MSRGHRIVGKPPNSHSDFVFCKRHDAEFGIISRGARAGMVLTPDSFGDILHDTNIIFIKFCEPFDAENTIQTGTSTPMVTQEDIVAQYCIGAKNDARS